VRAHGEGHPHGARLRLVIHVDVHSLGSDDAARAAAARAFDAAFRDDLGMPPA
jgi:hypothetical protein